MKIFRYILITALFLSGCAKETEPVEETLPEESPVIIEETEEEKGTLIKQEGPYGSISLSVPSDWKYRLCPVDDTNLRNADYGIQFYPAQKDGFIEIGYVQMFGVCGTGLTQNETTIAGQHAYIGTYDNHKRWDFISFTDQNIVVLNCSTEAWTDEEFEEVMPILNTFAFQEEKKSGAIGFYQPDSDDISIGLEVSVTNITSEGAIIHFNQYDDTKTNELTYGEDFTLEKKNGEDFEPVPRNEDIAIIAIAYGIPLMEISEHSYEWKYMYGSLGSGEYRLGVHVMEENNGYKDHMVYAHFIIADKK